MALQAWEHASSHRQISANASSFVKAFVNNEENNCPPSNLKAKSRTASDLANKDRNKCKAEALSSSLNSNDTALSPSASGGGATANITAAIAAPCVEGPRRETCRRSDGHVDGVAALWSHEDAIDAKLKLRN
jgi:hypothetical protein